MSTTFAAVGAPPVLIANPQRNTMTEADRKASRIFLHTGFIFCIMLQRFGIVAGTSTFSFCLPVMWGLVIWMLWSGRANFRYSAIMNLTLFLSSIMVSMAVALAFPDNRVGISLLSPVAIVMNYWMLIAVPNERFDKSEALKIFMFYMKICLIGGIAQYLLQFVGFRFFSFTITMPFLKPILIESRFAYDPIAEYGSALRRSNGLLMVEPSVFSQMIVLAVCIEYFLFNRLKWIPLYAIAYLFSASGTGALCFVLTIPFYVAFFTKQSGRIMLATAIGLMLVTIVMALMPELLATFTRRLGEFTTPGTSGYNRYIAQFEVVDVVIDEARLLIGYGPGATDRADFYVLGSGGAIQKLLIDYGLYGLLSFFSLMLGAIWRKDLAIVPLLLFMTFLFGGGKLLMAPFVVLMIMICIWCDPPTPAGRPVGTPVPAA